MRPETRIASSTRLFEASAISQSGRRVSAVHRPSRLAAYLTGPGLELDEQREMQRHEPIVELGDALSTSPLAQAACSWAHCRGRDVRR